MSAPEALAIVQSAYAAFNRGDIPAVLDLLSDDVEWKFCGSKGLPYTGTFRGKDEVAKFFASVPEVEDLLVFEPREFIFAGEKVAVLGWERSQVVRPSPELVAAGLISREMPGGDPPATLARSVCGRGAGHHTRGRVCSPNPCVFCPYSLFSVSSGLVIQLMVER